MSDCKTCNHYLVCKWANYEIGVCRFYEPERVKCGSGLCMTGISNDPEGVKSVCEFQDQSIQDFIWKYNYCPKCGCKIEVKE